ncbi:Phage-related protein [Micromonospora nigra]|uniref:Phage-related protein n=1 Tax=Micromonospora nigra TaxID=145857 RepID=A0A1C6RVI7_9ACTN|nr:type II toxin-antitoxin system RelE/ParE family toxin [Micromonospora nigra]SCL21227.1 Phage-related protein [Micromonospora nigra]
MYDSPRVRRVRFYKSETGNPVAREEFFALEEEGQAALGDLFRRYEHGLENRGEIKAVGKGLLEFRTHVRNNPYRAYFFQDGPKYVIVTLCVYKNQEKARKSDLDLARQRMDAWRKRGGK